MHVSSGETIIYRKIIVISLFFRYWYVLKDGTIFCYLTPDDNVTVDILNLQGYKVAYLIDKFRGKRFVLQLSHQVTKHSSRQIPRQTLRASALPSGN